MNTKIRHSVADPLGLKDVFVEQGDRSEEHFLKSDALWFSMTPAKTVDCVCFNHSGHI